MEIIKENNGLDEITIVIRKPRETKPPDPPKEPFSLIKALTILSVLLSIAYTLFQLVDMKEGGDRGKPFLIRHQLYDFVDVDEQEHGGFR